LVKEKEKEKRKRKKEKKKRKKRKLRLQCLVGHKSSSHAVATRPSFSVDLRSFFSRKGKKKEGAGEKSPPEISSTPPHS